MNDTLPPHAIRGIGADVITETQIDRDARHAAMLRMGETRAPGTFQPHVSVPLTTSYITPQQDPPKVVARDRATTYAIAMFVIVMTGGLAPLLPIDTEWLPAIGFVFAAISGAVAYWLRAIREGDKDEARAERV